MKKFLLLTILVTMLSAPITASAFRRSQTCVDPGDVDPRAPTAAPPCEGNEVPHEFYWGRRDVDFVVNRDGSDDFEHMNGRLSEDLETAVVESYETWNEPECSDFRFVYRGLTDVDRTMSNDRVNVLTWLDEGWPYSGSAYAVTTVTTTTKGEMVDADTELNGQHFTFTNVDDPSQTVVDVRNTVTHEAGHALGLDHSPTENSTMEFDAPRGELSKRDLHPDDVQGLCTIYPLGQDEEGPDDPSDNGCCATVADRRGASSLLLPLLLMGLVSWRRRKA